MCHGHTHTHTLTEPLGGRGLAGSPGPPSQSDNDGPESAMNETTTSTTTTTTTTTGKRRVDWSSAPPCPPSIIGHRWICKWVWIFSRFSYVYLCFSHHFLFCRSTTTTTTTTATKKSERAINIFEKKRCIRIRQRVLPKLGNQKRPAKAANQIIKNNNNNIARIGSVEKKKRIKHKKKTHTHTK